MPETTQRARDTCGRFLRPGDDPQTPAPKQRRQRRTVPPTPLIKSNTRWISRKQLAERWGCSVRTLERENNPRLVRLTPNCKRIDLHEVEKIEAERRKEAGA